MKLQTTQHEIINLEAEQHNVLALNGSNITSDVNLVAQVQSQAQAQSQVQTQEVVMGISPDTQQAQQQASQVTVKATEAVPVIASTQAQLEETQQANLLQRMETSQSITQQAQAQAQA